MTKEVKAVDRETEIEDNIHWDREKRKLLNQFSFADWTLQTFAHDHFLSFGFPLQGYLRTRHSHYYYHFAEWLHFHLYLVFVNL